MRTTPSSANGAWLHALGIVKEMGSLSSPRGMSVRERLCFTVTFRMMYPVVYERSRKLSYTFMAAEALWILSGSNRLEFHHEIADKLGPYSDNGKEMAGAYGPHIASQFEWVIRKLKEDRDTRQAIIKIWTRTPAPSKDIPCTLSMQFLIRRDMLHLIVSMRSSDVWMGLPYDMFSFSCVAQAVAMVMGAQLGICHITAGSSHLYEKDILAASDVLYRPRIAPPMMPMPSNRSIRHVLFDAMDSHNQSVALERLLTWELTDETA